MNLTNMVPIEEDGIRRVVRPGTPLYWCDARACFVVEREHVMHEMPLLGLAPPTREDLAALQIELQTPQVQLGRPDPPWWAWLSVIGVALVGGLLLGGFVWLAWLLAFGAEGL